MLLEGHQRVAAARLLKCATIEAQLWDCSFIKGLVRVLSDRQQRRWSVVEEAQLVRELVETHEHTNGKIARMLGKEVDWVNRCLAMVDEQDEAAWRAIQNGKISG